MARQKNAPARPEDIKEVWIEDGARIGEGAVILKGVRVGQGAVVEPHAVVTKSVPPHSVVAGNPARVLDLKEAAKVNGHDRHAYSPRSFASLSPS
jgi:acetyltransferase-like isoleucine patch superfamily enzyme